MRKKRVFVKRDTPELGETAAQPASHRRRTGIGGSRSRRSGARRTRQGCRRVHADTASGKLWRSKPRVAQPAAVEPAPATESAAVPEAAVVAEQSEPAVVAQPQTEPVPAVEPVASGDATPRHGPLSRWSQKLLQCRLRPPQWLSLPSRPHPRRQLSLQSRLPLLFVSANQSVVGDLPTAASALSSAVGEGQRDEARRAAEAEGRRTARYAEPPP